MSIWNQFQFGRHKYFISARQGWSIFFCLFEAIRSTFITSDWYFKVLSKWLTKIYFCHSIIAFWKKYWLFQCRLFLFCLRTSDKSLFMCLCLSAACLWREIKNFWIFWNCLGCHMFLCLYTIFMSVKESITSIFVDLSIKKFRHSFNFAVQGRILININIDLQFCKDSS